GADVARLAARRPQGHAHVGLWRARARARLERWRQVARDLGLDPAHPMAVPRQGWPHGQDAAHPGADGGAGGGRRGPPETGGGGGRVCRGPRLPGAGGGVRSGPRAALAWNATGTALAVGAEDGEAGVIDLG